MKRSHLYALVLLGLAACSSMLAGSLAVDHDGPTNRLTATFSPADGQSIDSTTTFAKFEAYECMVRIGGTASMSGCVPLPASGIVAVTLESVEPGATVDVSVWVDEPPKSTDEGALPVEPRPCQGVMIDRATWTNTATASVEEEMPPPVPGDVSVSNVASTCGPEPATISVENVGDGDLEIMSVDAEDGATVDVAGDMPMTLEPNETLEIEVTLDDESDGAGVQITTSDPDEPTVRVAVTSGPRVVNSQDRIVFEPGDRRQSFEVAGSCTRLGVVEVDIVAIENDPDGASVDDFYIEGCDELPCQLEDPVRIGVGYYNNDESTTDVATLTVSAWGEEPREILLIAREVPCDEPKAIFTATATTACVGESVMLDGTASEGAEQYEWDVAVLPKSEATLEDNRDGTAVLTPKEPGIHFVGLVVQNECDERSAREFVAISVDGSCED